MTFRLLIQKPPSLSNERLLGTSFDCQLSYYTAGNATLKVGVLTGVIIDKGKKCLRPKFTVQTKDNARLSCCFEIVPAFWLSDFRIFRLCQNSVQHATSFRCTRGLVKYAMKEKKKSTNIFNSVEAYFSLLELEWLSQKNSKKLPNFSELLCTKGRKWRSKKGASVCLRCMSQFLLDQNDHVSTNKENVRRWCYLTFVEEKYHFSEK